MIYISSFIFLFIILSFSNFLTLKWNVKSNQSYLISCCSIILLSFYYLNGVHPNKSFVAMTEWEKEINGYKILSNLEKDGTLKISHWMPIPESPKPPTQNK